MHIEFKKKRFESAVIPWWKEEMHRKKILYKNNLTDIFAVSISFRMLIITL